MLYSIHIGWKIYHVKKVFTDVSQHARERRPQ